MASVISDERFSATLGVYAGMADRVLDQPERWLAADPPEEDPSLLDRLLEKARHSVSGDEHPGSDGWSSLPLEERTQWWLRRISLTAGTAAAAPRFAGLIADRLPLQAALGASASGLAVCAVARENGITDPQDWVPLLGTVIFERDLSPAADAVPGKDASEEALATAPDDGKAPDETDDDEATLSERGRRVARGMWRLARTLLELQDVFEDRPRGGWLPRIVAKLPAVGVLGGWLDERGAVHASAKETQELLDARATSSG